MPALSPRRRGRRTINEINMVPFIDVMLVLLIIFMVTAPLISPSSIELPSVGQAPRQPDRFIRVMLHQDGTLQLQPSEASGASPINTTLRDLGNEVRQLQTDGSATPVVIFADKTVRYESVIGIMDALQKAGVARIALSVQPAR